MLFSGMCVLAKKTKIKISFYNNFYEGQKDKLYRNPISNKRNTNNCNMFIQCMSYTPNFITIWMMYNSTFIKFPSQMVRYKFYEKWILILHIRQPTNPTNKTIVWCVAKLIIKTIVLIQRLQMTLVTIDLWYNWIKIIMSVCAKICGQPWIMYFLHDLPGLLRQIGL